MSLTIFGNSSQMLNGKLFFTTNIANFFRIDKFIILFWSLCYRLISFFGSNALFMFFGSNVFRYVILPFSSYANVYSVRIKFSVFISFMTSTYERIIFLPSLLVLAATLLLLLSSSSGNSRRPFSLHLLVLTLSPTDAIKSSALHSCNDLRNRYQIAQFEHATVICYVISF